MRTACWASVLLTACLGCNQASGPGPASNTTASPTAAQNRPQRSTTIASTGVENGRTRVTIDLGDGRRPAVLLPRDATTAPEAAPLRVDLLGDAPGGAILIIDRYPSMAGGMSYCQSGEEHFLRVVSVSATPETWTMKIASCRDNIELTDRGVEWDAASATMRIHWLNGPQGKPEVRIIRIGADGRPARTP